MKWSKMLKEGRKVTFIAPAVAFPPKRGLLSASGEDHE
jgi:hypothetical protein